MTKVVKYVISVNEEQKKKCLFVDENCKHFTNGEHRCMIFHQKCGLMPKMEYGINQFGELVTIIFFKGDT